MLAPSYPHHPTHHTHNPMTARSGQILWIRGLTRLQTQVGHLIVDTSVWEWTLLCYIILVKFSCSN